MAVFHNVEIVRFNYRGRLALRAKAQKGEQFVVKGNRNRHVLYRYLDMVDYGPHLWSALRLEPLR